MKIRNRILAIDAAPAAIPPNPKIAATIATIKKVTVQRNIIVRFLIIKYFIGISICRNEKAVP